MIKRIISIAIIIVMALGVLSFSGCNSIQEDENGLAFYLNHATKEYSVYAGSNFDTEYTEVVIPSIFRGRPVTEIMYPGFNHMTKYSVFSCGKTDKIKSISIPASIKKIDGQFVGCAELESITVAEDNSVYKSEGNCLIVIASNMVLAGCGTSVIPDYITGISSEAFRETKIWNNTPNNSVVYVGKWVVGVKGNLDSNIALKPGTIGIGNHSFIRQTELENIELPSSLLYIGAGAFEYCKFLKSIELPTSLLTIGYYAFDFVPLTSIIIPLSVTHISRLVFKSSSLEVIYVEATEKPEGWSDDWAGQNNDIIVWGYKGDI